MKDNHPEFSRPVAVDKVQTQEIVQAISASPAERQQLAKRFDLQSLALLKAEVVLRRARDPRMIEVTGRLTAEAVQTCVVTLDPVPAQVEEEFSALYAPPELVPALDQDMNNPIDAESLLEDAPEPFDNGWIDIGELVSQHFFLALDPYPRSAEAHFEETSSLKDSVLHPFAALAQLKTKQ